MTRTVRLRHEYVEFIPKELEEGCIYISKRFKTASHLCCCGCKGKVVTPLNPSKWRLHDHGNFISLYPSIGNWSFPCQSHYILNNGQVIWAESMTKFQIRSVQQRDLKDATKSSSRKSRLKQLGYLMKHWFGGNDN